jgi:putative transposase
MARILLLMRVLESTLFYQQAWLFEPYFFRVHWTALTATRPAIPLVSPACQAGRRGILGLVGTKLRPLYRPNPDHQRIWSATFSKHHRFPAEIISHAVWLYFRFCLSYRDVEELLFARGVMVTYEAIRKWCRKFGQLYGNELRQRRPRLGDKWHLDEVFLTIHGKRHYLWRAVDQEGNILDILVQRRRDKKAAKKFFRKLLKGCQYVPRVIITDKLKSYGAAKREILPGVEHRQHRYLNNRAENSHQPTRQRERRLQGFKSPGHAQRFLSAYGPIAQHFRPRRHLLSARAYREEMIQRFQSWQKVTGLAAA